jgi:geranylgeranylglycerol-phosphate geranylgeranyltransferase
MFKKIRAFIRLFRPELPFAAGICILLGEVIALGKLPPGRETVLGFLCGFLISGAAIVANDYFDLEVDRVNTPERPIPAGEVSPTEAILLAAGASVLGLAASAGLGLTAFIFCLVLCLVSLLYNWKFKEAGLAGNLMVSFCVAFTFLLGGTAVGQTGNRVVWLFALMAFFVDLGEEIAGDAMDMDGDKKRNSQSIALRHGKKFALTISCICFGMVVLLGFVPRLMGWLGTGYLVVILLTDALITAFAVGLVRSRTPEAGRQCMRGIYLGALLGVMAFIAGMVFFRL